MVTASLQSPVGNFISKKSARVSLPVPTKKTFVTRDTQDLVRDSESFCRFGNICAYSHHKRHDFSNKKIMCEMEAKMQNLEIPYKVEINHLNNKLKLLSRKGSYA